MKKLNLLAGLVVGAMGITASAAPITLTSDIPQNGTQYPLTVGGQYAFTSGTGYNFTAQPYSTLTSITSVEFQSGDVNLSSPTNVTLELFLDNIDTGLNFSFFPGIDTEGTPVGGSPVSAAVGTQLLAALQADGMLVGSLRDFVGSGNSVPNPATNFIIFSNSAASANTHLALIGQTAAAPVPLPAAALLAPLGAAIAAGYARRFRRAK